MSFRCDHCGHRDSEINSAGEIQREYSYFIQSDLLGTPAYES